MKIIRTIRNTREKMNLNPATKPFLDLNSSYHVFFGDADSSASAEVIG